MDSKNTLASFDGNEVNVNVLTWRNILVKEHYLYGICPVYVMFVCYYIASFDSAEGSFVMFIQYIFSLLT